MLKSEIVQKFLSLNAYLFYNVQFSLKNSSVRQIFGKILNKDHMI